MLGAASAIVRAEDDAAIANTGGGGSMVFEEPLFDSGGEGCMAVASDRSLIVFFGTENWMHMRNGL